MREIIDEYGGSLLGAVGTMLVIGYIVFSFLNPKGLISTHFRRLLPLYLQPGTVEEELQEGKI